jgi:hypothetical protein
MKYVIEMASRGKIYIPSFMKIGVNNSSSMKVLP